MSISGIKYWTRQRKFLYHMKYSILILTGMHCSKSGATNWKHYKHNCKKIFVSDLCSECYGHWHCQDGAHNPYDQDDHLCAGLGGVALQGEHDGFISVNGYGSECKNAGIYTQILKYQFKKQNNYFVLTWKKGQKGQKNSGKFHLWSRAAWNWKGMANNPIITSASAKLAMKKLVTDWNRNIIILWSFNIFRFGW